MDYHRAEVEATKGINWGKKYYESTQDPGRVTQALAAKPRVQWMLENVVKTEEGPVDATALLDLLTDQELCDFFARIPKCKSIIMRNWTTLSETVVRAISFCIGANLVEVDFSSSKVSERELEVLVTNTSGLRSIHVNRCENVNSRVMALIAKSSSRTLRELYVQACPHFKEDPLLTMCGSIGVNAPKLSRLRVLDLNECPIIDNGLLAVAGCCKQLRFLNLGSCSAVTDSSLVAVAHNCVHLEVLNLFACRNITSKSIIALAKHCPQLHSLNLSKLDKVNDSAVCALGQQCSHLQALNLSGLLHVTESALYSLATGCPGLLMLNVTGCEHITVAGLEALARGLMYVEVAISYVGLKPKEGHVEKKLVDQIMMINEQAATTITRGFHAINRKLHVKAEYHHERQDKAARQITGSIYRYQHRLRFYKIWWGKKTVASATTIQRVSRGVVGRKIAAGIRAREAYFLAHANHALEIQRIYRGHWVRRNNIRLSRVLREMYIIRREEAEIAIAVRLQTIARTFLVNRQVRVLKELNKRRKMDEHMAIKTMQGIARVFLGKMEAKRKRGAIARRGEIRETAALRIQAFLRATQGRARLKQSKFEREMVMRAQIKAAGLAQRTFRGYLARNITYRMRIKLAERYFAAMTIQRVYRGTRIMQWRDMRLNIIAAYVLDRQYLERRESVLASRLRYKAFREENQKDSASEEEPEEHVLEWEKKWDNVRRRYYWYNDFTQSISYDEPFDQTAMAKGMVGVRIRVYWVAQRVWYEGVISRYHRRKRRHRIDYDDGDHEWMEIEVERERVQVQQADGSWIIYMNYRPPEMMNEWQKMESLRANEDFKKQAFKDADQWKVLQSDHTEHVMFISEVTGEIRTGNDDALVWSVQDDGHGFPCFYNTETGETVHDDPRFVSEITIDDKAQKDYILQELRIAMYFCKDYFEKYSTATGGLAYTDINDVPKSAMTVCMQVRNSSKPKHLVSFLIRAKALFKPVSVVDEPVSHKIKQELEYASWLAQQIAAMVQLADNKIVAQRDAQVIHTEKLLAKSKGNVFCSNCKRPTKKHYDFCKICGKRQLFLLDHIDEEVDDGSKLTKSELFALQHGGDLNHHDDMAATGSLPPNSMEKVEYSAEKIVENDATSSGSPETGTARETETEDDMEGHEEDDASVLTHDNDG